MRKSILLAVVLLSVASAASAWAHAHLQRALPAASSALAKPPKQVRLWFTEAIEPSLSGLEVADAAGTRVDKGDAHVVGSDAKQLVASLSAIEPGAYQVRWHVVSVDTHRSEGLFAFTVKP